MKTVHCLPCIAIVLISIPIQGQELSAPESSEEFRMLSRLVGTWEGTTDGGKTEASITYKLTGRGTSLVETLFPGTSMEMMTIYHDDADGNLVAKHFCVAMNQPQLFLDRTSEKELFFEHSADDPNVDEEFELHGHELALTFDGSDKLKLEWYNRKDGNAVGSREYNFRRIK